MHNASCLQCRLRIYSAVCFTILTTSLLLTPSQNADMHNAGCLHLLCGLMHLLCDLHCRTCIMLGVYSSDSAYFKHTSHISTGSRQAWCLLSLPALNDAQISNLLNIKVEQEHIVPERCARLNLDPRIWRRRRNVLKEKMMFVGTRLTYNCAHLRSSKESLTI